MCDHSFGSLINNTSSSPTPPEDQLIFWLMAGYIPNGIHNITQTKSKKNITKNKLLSLIITEVNILTRNILKEKKMSDKLQLTELMHEILLEDQTQALQRNWRIGTNPKSMQKTQTKTISQPHNHRRKRRRRQ